MNAPAKSHAPKVKAYSIKVIIPPDGTSCRATATSNLWVGVSPFSNPSEGNKAKALTSGKAYFESLLCAFREAKESIYITGWQVNWDAQMDSQGARLFDVLLNVAKNNKNIKIYVMPWDDTAPLQTYDDQTKIVLELINELTGRTCVFVNLAKSLADANVKFFSHHQKQVVIDKKICFIGGIDLAYGRFDDASYDLRANADGRAALNRYNGCVIQTGSIEEKDVVDPDILTGAYDRFSNNRKNALAAIQRMAVHQVPYEEDSPISPLAQDGQHSTLDEKTQPRMPWQDVHVKIEGPAVADLALNFVLRWNTEGGSPKLAVPNSSIHLPDGSGSCSVQVLRSAPKNMCVAEYPHLMAEDQLRIQQPIEAQANIAEAMKILIEKAEHFIYIENQFFVSGFGAVDGQVNGLATPKTYTGPAEQVNEKSKSGARATRWMPGDAGTLPQNRICELLAQRIDSLIISEPDHPFHVYITLPVHPEGTLDNGAVITQVHWTMQSLVFGSHSLLNRIRRSLLARELLVARKDDNDESWKRAYDMDINDPQFDKIKLEACDKYVTLLNLRNWANLGTDSKPHYVTEQVYIHSKMMIVDDRYALVGSANINDRSLMGGRDSELAVLIMDTNVEKVDLCGDGKKRPTRGFARQLRMEVWNKIFGITAGGSRAATELAEAVLKPGAPKSWEAIRKVAANNTKLYEAAFDFIPRNEDSTNKVGNDEKVLKASIWPRWHAPVKKGELWIQSGPMPFDEEFWSQSNFDPNEASNLEGVKGFITLLPIEWTKRENNNIRYHNSLMVNNETNKKVLPVQNVRLAAINKPDLDVTKAKV